MFQDCGVTVLPGVSSDLVSSEGLAEGRLKVVEIGEACDWLSVEDPRTEPAQSLQDDTGGRILGFVLLESGAQQLPHPGQLSLLQAASSILQLVFRGFLPGKLWKYSFFK